MTMVGDTQPAPNKAAASPVTIPTGVVIAAIMIGTLAGAIISQTAMVAFALSGLITLVVIGNLLVTRAFPYKEGQEAALNGVLTLNVILLAINVIALLIGTILLYT